MCTWQQQATIGGTEFESRLWQKNAAASLQCDQGACNSRWPWQRCSTRTAPAAPRPPPASVASHWQPDPEHFQARQRARTLLLVRALMCSHCSPPTPGGALRSCREASTAYDTQSIRGRKPPCSVALPRQFSRARSRKIYYHA